MGFQPTPTFVDQQKAPESEQASSLMRSMPVVNNSLHNEKDRNAILPTKGHTKETKQERKGVKQQQQQQTKTTYKVEHKTKSPAQKEAKGVGASSLETRTRNFSKSVTLWTPLQKGASSLETRTGNFSKSVTLWTPLQAQLL